jgi:hypothetical protein
MTKALDRRIILRASIVSSGSVLFIKYAKYGCIQVSSIIIISSGSVVLSVPDLLDPEPFVASWFNSPALKVLLPLIDL